MAELRASQAQHYAGKHEMTSVLEVLGRCCELGKDNDLDYTTLLCILFPINCNVFQYHHNQTIAMGGEMSLRKL
jgi:hypothetical protein